MKLRLVLPIFVAFASLSFGGHAQTPPSQAVNDNLPNPFNPPIEGWVKFPNPDRKLGATIGLSFDSKGHLWALDRCGGTSCETSTIDPVFEIDTKTGKVLKTFGGGLLVVPHDIFVDQNDHNNVWVVDQAASKAKDKGEQVWKFSPDGKLLMTLGKAGQNADTPDTFNDPTSVVTGKNGDIFVTVGHSPRDAAHIVKFDKNGKFIKTISQKGTGPGDLSEPHSITIDSKGRLLVADRGNVRISIFDQDGNFLETWKQFGIPTQVYVDKKTDTLYVGDNFIRPKDAPGAGRGIRIGSAKDGTVKYFIPDPNQDPKEISLGPDAAKGDGHGTLYVGENDRKTIKKFLMK